MRVSPRRRPVSRRTGCGGWGGECPHVVRAVAVPRGFNCVPHRWLALAPTSLAGCGVEMAQDDEAAGGLLSCTSRAVESFGRQSKWLRPTSPRIRCEQRRRHSPELTSALESDQMTVNPRPQRPCLRFNQCAPTRGSERQLDADGGMCPRRQRCLRRPASLPECCMQTHSAGVGPPSRQCQNGKVGSGPLLGTASASPALRHTAAVCPAFEGAASKTQAACQVPVRWRSR